ncbi:MAG: TIGR04255 family protein [Phycisphaerales bacterium]|nr:TIGR04255 family protein [Phycisphaerales bacterium]
MKTPKKISPNGIVDAIVEIRYTLNYPFEIALGIFYSHINDTYQYTSRPPMINLIPQSNQVVDQRMPLQLGMRSIFFNEKIKIEITAGSIIFNCLNEYISWDNYKIEIESFLKQLSNGNVIQSFNRVGIRYISHYPKNTITDITKFRFSLGMSELPSDTFSFHSEYKMNDYKVILNLNNQIAVFRANEKGEIVNTPTSVIDIDVIDEGFAEPNSNWSAIISKIEKAHLKEKEIFFSLLRESFLSTLKTEY